MTGLNRPMYTNKNTFSKILSNYHHQNKSQKILRNNILVNIAHPMLLSEIILRLKISDVLFFQ